MTIEQVNHALTIIGGVENIYTITLGDGGRVLITTEDDFNRLKFHEDKELFEFTEIRSGVKVTNVYNYDAIQNISGFTGEFLDPLVIDNQWRLARRHGYRFKDNTMEEALKNREEQKNLNSCENKKITDVIC